MLLFEYKTANQEEEKGLRVNTIDSLQTIHDTAKELIAFVNSYREFSRVATPQISNFQLTPFLQSVINLEEAELTKNSINTMLEITKEEAIQADQSLLSRVIINLLKNAIEALEEKQEKIIKIKTTSTEETIQIDICDNGKPVPTDMVNDIFVPFFTTKKTGSGIGLSVSRYILRLQNGTLKHTHNEGWTIFSVILPKAKIDQ
ncbi:MAG: HAMP domain-containing histidine kinase [Bacteroidales bacterium]|nr:HAMP domain-containing histidine kinase [Bacteroidales bacterium]